jgi:hypothetical protein
MKFVILLLALLAIGSGTDEGQGVKSRAQHAHETLRHAHAEQRGKAMSESHGAKHPKVAHHTKPKHASSRDEYDMNAPRVPIVFDNYDGEDDQRYGVFLEKLYHWLRRHDCMAHGCQRFTANKSVVCEMSCEDSSDRQLRHIQYDVQRRFTHPYNRSDDSLENIENHWHEESARIESRSHTKHKADPHARKAHPHHQKAQHVEIQKAGGRVHHQKAAMRHAQQRAASKSHPKA